MVTAQKKSVLITGCSTGGIGWAMAKKFQERGFHVFATARDTSKAADLSELSDVEILELDVTVPQTISRCKEIITECTGGRLDVLINNAGVESTCPLLDVDVAEAKKQYDVNVWGPLAMAQAFAPLLIKSKGVIYNQSSIDAALSMVWAGIYASSKAAEARISEILRLELEPLGVRVVTGMCGSADTPMFGKPEGRMKVPDTSHYYNAQEKAFKERMDHQKQAMKVDELANKLVKDIVGGAQGTIWHGAFAPTVRFITWAFPTWLVDKLVNSERGVDQIKIKRLQV